ncbi:S41 family peptidase [Crocinitomix catalasitica]|uniref:S41 family peptidase n=1 Tax=Crocinitomix catalasitica TaxID=184607 RepID=UPI00048404C6|nr:S41 family peptidase [Crocinitomix catalasitica]
MIRLKIFTAFFLTINLLYGQTYDTISQKQLLAEQMVEDLDILVNSLADAHPTLYQYISKENLHKKELEIRAEINSTKTVMMFYRYVAEYVKEIRCGHTVAMQSADYYQFHKENPLFIPLDVYLQEGKLYVKHIHQKAINIPNGSEILEIDNRTAGQILKDMNSIVSRDGFSSNFRDVNIEGGFSSQYLFLYGQKEYHTIVIKNNNTRRVVILKSGKPDKLKKTIQKDTSLYTLQMSVPGINYHTFGSNSLPFIDLNSFERNGYKKFYKKVFADLEESEAENLVIDLRGNGGGYFLHVAELLKYIAREDFTIDKYRNRKFSRKNKYLKFHLPTKALVKIAFDFFPDSDRSDPRRNYQFKFKIKRKNHFKGKIYVLTDGYSFSASANLASKIKHHCNATFIGTETGGNEEGCNGTLFGNLTLPNSKIRITVPIFHVDNKVKLDKNGRGVIPDIQVDYSVEERLNGIDKEMQELEKLIMSH